MVDSPLVLLVGGRKRSAGEFSKAILTLIALDSAGITLAIEGAIANDEIFLLVE